jgi:hypothetical protein
MLSEFAALEVTNVLIACALICGLYLLCRDVRPLEEKKAARKMLVSHFKPDHRGR